MHFSENNKIDHFLSLIIYYFQINIGFKSLRIILFLFTLYTTPQIFLKKVCSRSSFASFLVWYLSLKHKKKCHHQLWMTSFKSVSIFYCFPGFNICVLCFIPSFIMFYSLNPYESVSCTDKTIKAHLFACLLPPYSVSAFRHRSLASVLN